METINCLHCDKVIFQPATGRKRKFCENDGKCKDAYHNSRRTKQHRQPSEDKQNDKAILLSQRLTAELLNLPTESRADYLKKIISAIAFNTISMLENDIYKKSHVQKALTFQGNPQLAGIETTQDKIPFAYLLGNFCAGYYGFRITDLFRAVNGEPNNHKIEYFRKIIGDDTMDNSLKDKLKFVEDDPLERRIDGLLNSVACDILSYPKGHEMYEVADRFLKSTYDFDIEKSDLKYSADIVYEIELRQAEEARKE